MTQMKESLSHRLLSINRHLYTTQAESFSATRFREQPGYHRLLDYVHHSCALLDIGCGNGRWAAFLDDCGRKVRYVGVDFSAQLVDMAQERANRFDGVQAQFVVADILRSPWCDALLQRSYDVVSALAVLHHLPGAESRQALFHQVYDLLVPGGLFLFSTWQFTESERMRRKIVPWHVVGMDDQAVEPGDYLLAWRAGNVQALRYCHLIDEQEVRELATHAGFTMRETFRSDGREGNLSLYVVLHKE